MQEKLQRLLHWLHALESGVLALLLVAMIGLSISDIVMRNLFNSGFALAPQLVRILVLWLGLLGALYATRYNKHITVDVLARLLPLAARRLIKGVTSLFASAVCAIIAWYSYLFVRDSWSYGDVVFNDIPAWLVQAVIPASFLLVSIRFLIHAAGQFFFPGNLDQAGDTINQERA